MCQFRDEFKLRKHLFDLMVRGEPQLANKVAGLIRVFSDLDLRISKRVARLCLPVEIAAPGGVMVEPLREVLFASLGIFERPDFIAEDHLDVLRNARAAQ